MSQKKHSIKRKLLPVFSPFLYPIIRAYWFVFRPRAKGVKIIAMHGDAVLIVRHTYGWRGWTFPGGKIDNNETPQDAAKRELLEETGIQTKSLTFLGSFWTKWEYRGVHLFVFHTAVDSKHVVLDSLEIAEARWVMQTKVENLLSPVGEKMFSLFLKE